ncbi:MAG TPA: hypothetical protein DCS07_13470 [Bdellovibrionales bacterium]|nr:MAG: hypothetical protein A2Z97_10765 [Bdellovibrionales bacterium GWB1_52_6]OFZ03375.1 MAG: hypothetical protein A2X97_05370 [Bdellovibrionales bacterium GWA1_52_35]HAR43617.1 hypothetical protein [Bdellovibrionales bacterium]HCM40958.1 hypothetical protein [Bdellovibrionales bacterium]
MIHKTLTIVSLFIISTGLALAESNTDQPAVNMSVSPGLGLMPMDSNCATVKDCVCYEVCNDVCRIVNSEKVCDESCNTICE